MSAANDDRLQAGPVRESSLHLQKRVEERFPGAGISRVAGRVAEVCARAEKKAASLGSANWPLRLLMTLLIAVVVGTAGWAAWSIPLAHETRNDLASFVQFVEAGIGALVFCGAFVIFLASLERRWKRGRALRALHELRSLAHIVDMHQLTKDPEKLLFKGPDTPSSPKQDMSAFQFSRYFDYCTEMLAFLSKVAALYVEHLDDGEVLAAVDQIETLTNGLARKIWQKMMLLESLESGRTPRL